MKRAYTGKESSGKNYMLCVESLSALARNKHWFKITGYPRTMVYDSPMSEQFIKRILDAGLKYKVVSDLMEINELQHCDIFLGEVSKYYPASGSEPLPPQSIDFLTQGAKSGVNMFVGAQDFSQVHKSFRLLMNQVYTVTKLLGSSRPHASRPPVKRVWGLIMIREVAPSSFKGDSATMEQVSFLPSFQFIERSIVEMFDTNYKVPPSNLPPRYVRKQEVIGKGENGEIEYKKVVWR